MRISLILISILFVFASNSMLGEEANKGLEIAIESDKR